MGSLFSFVRDMCRKGSGYMDAKDFMKSYEEHIKNVKGGNIKMKELFNPEEKNNEEMKSMDLFSKATSTKEKRVPNFSAEANTSEKIEEEEDNGEKGDSHANSLAQELFQQEVNFSKTGTVNSAAEELELPDNMDMTALEDEDGDSDVIRFPTAKGRTMAEFEAQCKAQRQREKEKSNSKVDNDRFRNRFSKDSSNAITEHHKSSGRTRSEFDKQCEHQRRLNEERKRKIEDRRNGFARDNSKSGLARNNSKSGLNAMPFDLSKDETGFKPESRTVPKKQMDLSNTIILTFPEGIRNGDNNTLTFTKGKYSYIVDLTSKEAKEECAQTLRKNTYRSFAWFQESTGNKNWVLFDLAQYAPDKKTGLFLHVKKIPEGTLELPVNASSCYKMFSDTEINDKFSFTKAFDTTDIVTMANMFENAKFTSAVYFPTSFNTENVVDMSFMFAGATIEVPFRFTDAFNAKKAINLEQMFCRTKFKCDFELPESFSPEMAESFDSMFSSCIVDGDFKLPRSFSTVKAKTMSRMFSGFKFPADFKLPKYFSTESVTNFSAMFCDSVLPNVTNIIENFKTGNGTDFSSMFLHAVLPDNFKLPESFSTANAVNMLRLFYGCKFPKGFKLPESFSTEKAVIISEMFCQCIFKSGFSLPPAFTIENAEKKDFIFTEAKGLGVITLTLRQIVKALHARYNSENQKNEDENSSYNGMELPSFAKKKK